MDVAQPSLFPVEMAAQAEAEAAVHIPRMSFLPETGGLAAEADLQPGTVAEKAEQVHLVAAVEHRHLTVCRATEGLVAAELAVLELLVLADLVPY